MGTSLQQKISNRQLEIWSNQGAVDTPKRTHERIRSVLAYALPVSVETFLQGSYANTTNIYGESDVDIVSLYTGAVKTDFSRLSWEDRLAQEQHWSPASYGISDLHRDVVDTLTAEFGIHKVKPGAKAIKVINAVGAYDADVLPCLEHRRYCYAAGRITYDTGISFWNSAEARWVTNFPKQHRENGAVKNNYDRTRGNYKAVVRVFKNLRCKLIADGLIPSDIAPSYFLECLLFNAPDGCYRSSSYSEILESIFIWFFRHRDQLDNLLCQNGLTPLFGEASECWDVDLAKRFMVAAFDYCFGY